jgi:hypothetical protein
MKADVFDLRGEISRSYRDLGHRLGELREENRREHSQVAQQLGRLEQRIEDQTATLDGRVDALESERDVRLGLARIKSWAANLVPPAIGGLAGAIAAVLFS